MHSNSRAARRAFLFFLMLGALGAQRADAQYFTSKPVDTWRTATGQSAPAPITKSPRSSLPATDALSKENLENMNQTSAVRVGCGVSSVEGLANLSVGFTKVVGITWGAVIVIIGLFSLKGRKGSVSYLVRGGVIGGFALAAPAILNTAFTFLSMSSTAADPELGVLIAIVGIIASLLGLGIMTSPDKLSTTKRIGKAILFIGTVLALGAGWLWGSSAIESARHASAQSESVPAYTTPNRTVSPIALPGSIP